MVAALLHDIGKGGLTEHSVAGEPIARADRDPDGLRARGASTLIATLVRWHLLLAETATTRDPDDPATVRSWSPRGSARPRRSTCCAALTEADARATAPQGVVVVAGRPGAPTSSGGSRPGRWLRAAAGRRPRSPSRSWPVPAEVRRRPDRAAS